MKISIIAAVAENGVIGRDGDLPWRLPADLEHFKDKTKNHTVIVGRKTHESILRGRKGRPLPDRYTIVVTRQPEYESPGCEVVHSWEEALERVKGQDEVFVIGGADLFGLAIPASTRMYLTRVHVAPEGDTFFPDFVEEEWRLVWSEPHGRDEHGFTFEVWERRYGPPLPIPKGMTKDEIDAMTVQDDEWRENHEYICCSCGNSSYLHPYTNLIWGCKHCGYTTYSVSIYFKPREGEDDAPVKIRFKWGPVH